MRWPARTDALIACGLAAGAIAEHALAGVAAPVATLNVVACAAVAWRRVAPVATCLAVIVLMGVPEFFVASASDTFLGFAALILALFSLTAHARADRAVPAAVAALALVCVVSVEAGLNDETTESTLAAVSGGVLFALVILGVPTVAIGFAARRHADLRRRLAEQAAALEAERELHAAAAAAGERRRVAGDLHALVASGVEAMLAELDGARAALRADPAAAAPAIRRVEDRGREALAEMRRLLGVLRRGDEDLALAPLPSLGRLDALARHRTGAGRVVDFRVEGTPRDVAPGLGVAAYRVVEHALDRAAAARRTGVVLRWTDRSVELDVDADGPQLAEVTRDDPLRELVQVFSGRLSTSRRGDGGSALHAALPVEAPR